MAESSLAVDPDLYETDSCYGSDDWQSETESIGSSIYQGLIDNGRRYQTLRTKEYCIPSDELQFEAYEAGHLVCLLLDSDCENPYFHAPIGKDPEDELRILDIGTGKGTWPIEVADMFPNSSVRGVDLYPPPVSWTPPNCVLEVDDVLREWLWRDPFDLIHIRIMLGAFDQREWRRVYKQCYDKLQPGGWFEQLEVGPFIQSDDGSLPPHSALASWGRNMVESGARAGRPCDIILTMASEIEKAGFVDVQEKTYKWPIGPWAREPRFKDAGTVNMHHWMRGIEGWCMWLLTKYGTPAPWAKEEVYVYCAALRNEMKSPHFHAYHTAKRVWARKPMPGEVPCASPSASTALTKST